jgi:alcohol dehydrogenase (cytochrome c)
MLRHRYCWFMHLVTAAMAMTAATAATTAIDAEWPSYNRGLDGDRFSPLTLLNTDSAHNLRRLCSVQVASSGAFHASPLIVDGMLFVAATHTTMAIDPVTCEVIWKSLYSPTAHEVYGTVRGVAIADGRLFRGTIDGYLLAYNARSGELIWRVKATDSTVGEFLSAAPIVNDGRVYIGLAGGDWGIRGKMLAFDAVTGAKAWEFDLIPRGGESGAETWKADSAQHGGGGTWTSYTLDAQRRELFVPVGNPAPDLNFSVREGDNLYTNSLVVLDADTGKIKWWYQVTPRDDRDHDLSAPPLLMNLTDGRAAVVLGSKNGYVLVIDRKTHKLIYKTAVTTISYERSMLTSTPSKVCPGMVGGIGWNGPALDIAQRVLVVGATDWCSMMTRGAPQYEAGSLYYAGTYEWVNDPPPTGWITALDADSGHVRWRFHAPAPVVSGITPTAGGITFAGDFSGQLYVFRTRDGKVLYKTDTGGAVAGGISTYSVRGRQYVALTSGNVSRESWGAVGTPSVVIYGLDPNDAPSDPGSSDPNVEHGAGLFASNCSLCHGTRGEGLTGPPLAKISARLSAADIADRVRNPLGAMPRLHPSPLSTQDVIDIAEYVHALL